MYRLTQFLPLYCFTQCIHVYTLRVYLFMCAGEWRKALHLLLRMINAGLEPDLTAYNAAIAASAKCGTLNITFTYT
jgi:pentatricopeptide repeat protein